MSDKQPQQVTADWLNEVEKGVRYLADYPGALGIVGVTAELHEEIVPRLLTIVRAALAVDALVGLGHLVWRNERAAPIDLQDATGRLHAALTGTPEPEPEEQEEAK